MARKGAEVLGIDLATQGAAGRAAARAGSRHAGRRIPRDQRRGAGGRAAGQLRRGDLHGDAGARARSGVGRRRPAPRWSKPGGWVFFSTINRNPKAFLFAIVGAEYVLSLLPRGTHEYLQVHPARANSPRYCRAAGLDVRQTRGPGIQPADAALLAERRHQRQLPGRHAASPPDVRRTSAAVLFDLDGTLIDSAPDLGRRRRPDAHRIAACRRCRSSATARWPAPARAACSASLSASRRTHAGLPGMREEFFLQLRSAHDRSARMSSKASPN